MIKSLGLLFTLSLLATSCGVDHLSGSMKKSNLSSSVKECAIVEVTSPVCANGTTYKNDTYAICDGHTKISPGRCNKTNDEKVCLSDGQTYGEKDAFELMAQDSSLKIKQYAACDVQLFD